MPTGYTADVADGKISDLEPFVMQLARGMGALIMMRDSPHDAPVPDRFEPSDYHTKKLDELRAEQQRLRDMPRAEAQAAADVEVATDKRDRENYFREQDKRRARYDAMIAKLEAWENPPEGIKEFGLEQLRTGREFDCPLDRKWYRDPPISDGEEWRAAKLDKAAEELRYHAVENAKEVQRTEDRNAWLAHLRKSLRQLAEAA